MMNRERTQGSFVRTQFSVICDSYGTLRVFFFFLLISVRFPLRVEIEVKLFIKNA